MRNSHSKTIVQQLRNLGLAALALVTTLPGAAEAFTLSVVDHAGSPISSGFSWLLEEDNTTLTVLPVAGQPITQTRSVSLDIHQSYAPVVGSGRATSDSTVITLPDPAGRYVLSVLPDVGYTLGGTNVSGNPATVRVVVHAQPIPTAQISVLVFKDHAPINNAFDAGETPLADAVITISDAGGQMMQDAFGNPLGTSYTPNLIDPSAPIVNVMGNGIIKTDAFGTALIENIHPGKYGVVVTPPTPAGGGQYIQTSTIEGTRVVDAWVKADEPPVFVEGFGTGFNHVFVGFVNPNELPWYNANLALAGDPGNGGTNAITGDIRYNHFGRPPANQGFFIGPPVKDCWIGVNDPLTGQGLYAAACYDGMTVGGTAIPSSFYIPNVPPGTYQLVTWDKPLDALFGFKTVTMPNTGTDLNLGTILSFRWFGSFLGKVFLDDNENGFREADEIGLAEQNINIRFRDGSVYQSQPTDINGGYALEEVFPFFKWLVVEVDFARFKATGITTAIDYGGEIPAGFDEDAPWAPLPKVPTFDQLNPQPQAEDNPYNGNNLSRTETGPVLTQAMLLFLNQTNVIDWGKNTYTASENGGISGIVYYAVTRAENDPQYAVAEPWEPGIPRVQINLYQDSNDDGVIDDVDGDNLHTAADVDNYPLANFPGTEDLDRNGNGIFDSGDALNITYTDSFNDNAPSNCIQTLPVVHGQAIPECADSFGTWNQVRPGTFDGGYAFSSYFPGGMNSGSQEVTPLPTGRYYIIEASTPPGYTLLKEQDKNVDFGNTLQPSTQLLAPACVGDLHQVPAIFSFQTDDSGAPLPGIALADLLGNPLANQDRPLCDRKKVGMSPKKNGAADFFFFTRVPKAARAVGFANNDLSAEFNQGSPNFGEKAAPSWIPVSFKDWKGNEVTRVYTDEFGGYNALLPSTFTVNVASPSGISPNILTLTLNDPNLPDGSPDPNYDPDYSVTSWSFQYEAGKTSYLDTPLVPVAAFVNFPYGKLDAEPRDKTPVLAEVTGPETAATGFGPLICTDRANGTIISLTSAGQTTVPNPDYSINGTAPVTVTRDYGFGATEGKVLLDGVDITTIGTSAINSWSDTAIGITLDPAVTTGLLTVQRNDNARSSETGITLIVTACDGGGVHFVSPGGAYPAKPIQSAIDALTTNPGDLILVAKGSYPENVIMDKPVRLQGSGGANTVIVATPNPSDRLTDWHSQILSRLGNDPFVANELPGIMVLGAAGNDFNVASPGDLAVIDGLAIVGGIAGGGLTVHTMVHDLVISNNRIINNQGQFAGGIAIGTPDTGIDADNDNVVIRGNLIAKNGGIGGAGGLGIYTGADNYLVENNIIVGNFSRFSGAGINHVGYSDGGRISHNKILFNEIFYGMLLAGVGDGGGINLAGEVVGGDGAGTVTVDGNLIQGNLTGSGKGGGINAFAFDDGGDNSFLHITNNLIINNVAGYMAGGLYLHDIAAGSLFYNNTVANNDASATAALAFAAGASISTPQPAGLVISARSADNTEYPAPDFYNNIFWHNRSFKSDGSYNNGSGGLLLDDYWDLAVVNTATPDQLNPAYSILTSLTGPNGEDYDTGDNVITDPAFVHPFSNTLYSAAVADEGGNSISVRLTPLSEGISDYHLTFCSPAVDNGFDTGEPDDYDRDLRNDGNFDIGADEYVATQTNYTTLVLLSPNGGELVPSGSVYTIAWGAPAALGADHFVLSYSLDNGATWVVIDANVPAISFCYPWTLPQEALNSSQLRVKVEAFADPAGTNSLGNDISDAPLTLDIQALLAPNGGEVLIYDAVAAAALTPNTYEISWQNPYGTDALDVITLSYRLAPTDAWTLISTLGGGATSDTWTIPAVTVPVYTAQLQLTIRTSTGTLRLTDISANAFTIRPAPPIAPAVPPVDPPQPPTGGVIAPPTTGAGIIFQCPDATGQLAVFNELSVPPDGILRADEGEITNPLYPNQVCLHLAAGDGFSKMADGKDLYIFGFSNVTGVADDMVMDSWNMGGSVLGANFPAPLLKFKEGDKVYLTLSNVGMMMRPDLFDAHSVHWHGFPNASAIFDGVPDASIAINMGSSLTYFYNVVEPGTFMYHCHVEATEHMQMGMLGNLYVAPAQDGTSLEYPLGSGKFYSKFAYNDGDGSTGYDVEKHIQMASFDPDFHDASLTIQPLPFALMDDRYPLLNGRGYPDTVNTTAGAILNQEGHVAQPDNALITADKTGGDRRILLRLSSLSTTSFHTITVLGIPMQVVGMGSRQLSPDLYRLTNSITIGGGQSADLILDLTNVDPGTYFLYVNNLDHLANHSEDYGGMMTKIVIQ